MKPVLSTAFAAAIVALTLAPGAAGATEKAAPEPVPVVAIESNARSLDSNLVLRGRTEANRHMDVMAETSGLVVSAPIRKGARVAAGDLLCRIDEGVRPAQLAEAEARIKAADATARAAERLSKKGFGASNSAETSRAELEAARAAAAQIRKDIERLSLTAPFDGVLESDTAELGALLQFGGPCATLIALDPVKIVGYAPERDVDKIRTGRAAGARLITGREVRGEVSFVSRASDDATRTYRIELTVPNPDLSIRDGMTAEIAIPLETVAAHKVPQSALTLDDDGRMGVKIVEQGKAVFTPVEILRDGAGVFWITGPPETAHIIVVGQEFVRDGRDVVVTPATLDQLL